MVEHLKKKFIVSKENHNERVDTVLAQLCPEYSRSLISNWIKQGKVTINNSLCKPKTKVSAEDILHVDVEYSLSKDKGHYSAQAIALNIVFEDDDLIIVNKPAGLVVHPGAGNPDRTLVNALLHHNPDSVVLPRAGIVHRLDKETSGLLVVAKNLVTHTALIRQMQARNIQRHYLALVQGYLISGGTIDTEFGRHPRNRLKMSVLTTGRQAITHYTINTQYPDYTLLDVKLMTGRTHQIRVHFEHINHPLVGDPLYGGRARIPTEAPQELISVLQQFKRQALHACKLSLVHPNSLEELTFTAPVPEDFNLLLKLLSQHYENYSG